MAKVTHHINAPITDVFAILQEGWAFSNWVVGTAHVHHVDPHWPHVGSRIWVKTGAWPFLEPASTEVLRHEPPTRLTLRPHGRWGELRVDIRLKEQGPNDTVVKLDEWIESGPLRLARNKVNDLLMHARNNEALRRLAHLVEGSVQETLGQR